jgi:hypothetical protein
LSIVARLIESGTSLAELLAAVAAMLVAAGLVITFLVLSARQGRQRTRRIDRAARPPTARCRSSTS